MGQLQTTSPMSDFSVSVKREDLTGQTKSLFEAYASRESSSEKFDQSQIILSEGHSLSRGETRSSAHLGSSNRISKRPRGKTSRKKPNHYNKQDDDQESDCSSSDECYDRANTPSRHETTNVFACHFFRWRPAQHLKCMKLKLTRIKDIRQHIQRHHTPLYCPSCYQKFSSRDEHNKHISDRGCEPRPPSDIDLALQKLTDHRADRKLSKDKQWIEIWDGLFPNTPLRQSPYLGSVVEETVYLIRTHWEKEHARILTAFDCTRDSSHYNTFSELLDFVAQDFSGDAEQETPTSNRQPTPTDVLASVETCPSEFSNLPIFHKVNSTSTPFQLNNMDCAKSSSSDTQSDSSAEWAEAISVMPYNCHGLPDVDWLDIGPSISSFNCLYQKHQSLDNLELLGNEFFPSVGQSDASKTLFSPYPQMMDLGDIENMAI